MIKKIKAQKKDLGINEQTTAIMDSGYFCESEIMQNKKDKEVKIIIADKEMAMSFS